MGPREAKGRTTLRVTAADGSRVSIHVFPHDARFVRDVERALEGVGAPGLPEPQLRDRVEARLRGWYPMLELHRRDDLAEIDQDEVMWYALRDGYVSRPRQRIDRLHGVMSDARITSATSIAVLEQARRTLDHAAHARHGRGAVAVADDRSSDADELDTLDERLERDELVRDPA